MAVGPVGAIGVGQKGSWWFNLSWAAVTGAKRYEVGVGGGFENVGTSTVVTVTDSALHTIGGLKTYLATVRAYDALSGGAMSSNSVSVTTTAVDQPASFTAGAPGITSVGLSWTKGNENTRNTYQVRNATLGRDITTRSGTFTGSDTGLAPGGTYTYTAATVDASGSVSAARSLSVTLRTYSAPGTPSFSGIGYYGFTASWSPCPDAGITGYEVYVEYTGGGSVTSRGVAGTSTAFTGLSESTGYRVYVRGYDAAGNRTPFSGVGYVTTAAVPPPPEPVWTHSPHAALL